MAGDSWERVGRDNSSWYLQSFSYLLWSVFDICQLVKNGCITCNNVPPIHNMTNTRNIHDVQRSIK